MGLNHVNFIYATLLFLLNDILSYALKKSFNISTIHQSETISLNFSKKMLENKSFA